MKKNLLFILIFVLMLGLVSCSNSMEGKDYTTGYDYYNPEISKSDTDVPVEGVPEEKEQQEIAGLLTCSVLDDVKGYNYFLSLSAENNQNNTKGQFNHFVYQYSTLGNLYVNNMVSVECVKTTLDEQKTPITDAFVGLYSGQDCLYLARTNVFGMAYVFIPKDYSGSDTDLVIKVVNKEEVKEVNVNEEKKVLVTFEQENVKQNSIDLLFVVDTTGSMGDELRFLQNEIKNVVMRIKNEVQDIDIMVGLLFYRDNEKSSFDFYLTRKFDFTNNLDDVLANIGEQKASGGGDFPEAVDIALSEAVNNFTWREQATKMIIHVLDAPPHSTQENISLYNTSLKQAAEKGIILIPVASSGIDKATEYLLRAEALMTGGRYVYLTDDSGIGNSHLPASTEKPLVIEYLNEALIRLVVEYHTGVVKEPVSIFQQPVNEVE